MGCAQRIQRIGLTEFDEATAVLRQEHFLLPPGDARTTYEEFAAVYLELRYFAPHLLPLYFPACTRLETIEAVLAEDVDAAGLFAATRLEGAADPARDFSPSKASRVASAPSDSDESEALGSLTRPRLAGCASRLSPFARAGRQGQRARQHGPRCHLPHAGRAAGSVRAGQSHARRRLS